MATTVGTFMLQRLVDEKNRKALLLDAIDTLGVVQ